MAGIEAAFILLPFFTMLFMTIETAAYFILRSALDTGVLTAAEALSTGMAVGSSFVPPSPAALKSTIISNGGMLFSASTVSVDVRQLATLSSAAVAVTDGTNDWGSSGSVLVLRAMATVPFYPLTTTVTMASTSIIRRPPTEDAQAHGTARLRPWRLRRY